MTRVGQTVLVRLMEPQIWHLPAGSVGEKIRKETMTSASTSVWDKAALPALILKPDSSVLPHTSLLPQHCSSDQVSLCMGRLRGIPGTLEASISHTQPQSPLVFTARSYRDFSSWHWNPGRGALMWGWSCDIPLEFYPPHISVKPAHIASPSLLPASMWLLLYIFSCRTSVQLDFKWSFRWFNFYVIVG